METKRYKDSSGNLFLEVISRQYAILRELEKTHQKLKRQTWFNLYNSCDGTWMLTINMGGK